MKRIVSIFIVLYILISGLSIETSAAGFSPRMSEPSTNDYHYYSDNPFFQSGYGMPNCTAYAWGRAYEILGSKPNLSRGNAGAWYNYNKNNGIYPYGSTPKLGAIACWDKYDSNQGHVAVVEAINGNNITISESHYNSTNFDTRTITSNSSNYLSSMRFLGYIYIGEFESKPTNPTGNFEFCEGGAGYVTVSGWAYDPDDPSQSLTIHVYIGGQTGTPDAEVHGITTDLLRNDVNSSYGISGNHGFSANIRTSKTGQQPVYVYAINIGQGGSTLLGSSTVNIIENNVPEGVVDIVRAGVGEIYLQGWTFDPDDISNPTEVHVYVGGQPFEENVEGFKITADNERSDIAEACGPNHGFMQTIKTKKTGIQPVYIYFIDNYLVENKMFGPYTVNIIDPNPIMHIDKVTGGAGEIFVSGWVYDNDDLNASLSVHVYVGGVDANVPGVEIYGIKADKERNDVNEAQGCGKYHGFSANIPVNKRGEQEVYFYAINIGNGGDTRMGAYTANISEPPPATPTPSATPESTPSAEPTNAPTTIPASTPTAEPTNAPTAIPATPTAEPTNAPTTIPTSMPTAEPTSAPTAIPTNTPAAEPTSAPTAIPTNTPTAEPTSAPTAIPANTPTAEPTNAPTTIPTSMPTAEPTNAPTAIPTNTPTAEPVYDWEINDYHSGVVTITAPGNEKAMICIAKYRGDMLTDSEVIDLTALAGVNNIHTAKALEPENGESLKIMLWSENLEPLAEPIYK